MATTEEKQRAAAYVLQLLRDRGWSERRLLVETDLDDKTVRTFLGGRTYPQEQTRNAIEAALGVPVGAIDDAKRDLIKAESSSSEDPVEAAIYRSSLTRANQLKLAGIYYEMLESQQSQGVRGA